MGAIWARKLRAVCCFVNDGGQTQFRPQLRPDVYFVSVIIGGFGIVKFESYIYNNQRSIQKKDSLYNSSYGFGHRTSA